MSPAVAEKLSARCDVVRSWDDEVGEIAPKSVASTRRVPLPGTRRAIMADHVRRTGRDGDDSIFGATGRAVLSKPRPSHGGQGPKGRGVARVTLHECRHGYAIRLPVGGAQLARR
jgi:hypothetical protein